MWAEAKGPQKPKARGRSMQPKRSDDSRSRRPAEAKGPWAKQQTKQTAAEAEGPWAEPTNEIAKMKQGRVV